MIDEAAPNLNPDPNSNPDPNPNPNPNPDPLPHPHPNPNPYQVIDEQAVEARKKKRLDEIKKGTWQGWGKK